MKKETEKSGLTLAQIYQMTTLTNSNSVLQRASHFLNRYSYPLMGSSTSDQFSSHWKIESGVLKYDTIMSVKDEHGLRIIMDDRLHMVNQIYQSREDLSIQLTKAYEASSSIVRGFKRPNVKYITLTISDPYLIMQLANADVWDKEPRQRLPNDIIKVYSFIRTDLTKEDIETAIEIMELIDKKGVNADNKERILNFFYCINIESSESFSFNFKSIDKFRCRARQYKNFIKLCDDFKLTEKPVENQQPVSNNQNFSSFIGVAISRIPFFKANKQKNYKSKLAAYNLVSGFLNKIKLEFDKPGFFSLTTAIAKVTAANPDEYIQVRQMSTHVDRFFMEVELDRKFSPADYEKHSKCR